MSAVHRLPKLFGIAGMGALTATMASLPAVRARLSQWLGIGAPGGFWRIFAILLALANLKNLPFVWHVRLYRAVFYHLYFQPTPIPPTALFKPSITTSRSPAWECDYNLHKSNSTYFSDLDIARTHLVTALLRNGVRKVDYTQKVQPNGEPVPPGKFFIALGAVGCVFKKEILPYSKFEIWTRLLTWDRKWLFIVSHMVVPGTFKPTSYALQPWRKGTPAKGAPATPEEAQARAEQLAKGIYATSIAKYVVKKGRMTIPVEKVLQDSDMLPPKPEGAIGANDSPSVSGTSSVAEIEADILAESFFPVEGTEWTWERVEQQRRKGLRYAQMFSGLDGLHGTFDGGDNGAMGEFGDLVHWG